MIPVENEERAIRIIESMNALAMVLPMYDPEARAVFRACFKIDMWELMPKFFADLARLGLEYEQTFMEYLDYVQDLINYIKDPAAPLPIPSGADPAVFARCRREAERQRNEWFVRPVVEDPNGLERA